MIPSDLVRARVKGHAVFPHVVALTDPAVQQVAQRIVEAFAAGATTMARHGDVLEELEAELTPLAPAKLVRGLLRVATNRADTESPAGLDAKALRMTTFLAAAAARAAGAAYEAPAARVVLETIGAEQGISAEEVRDALFSDLPSERRIAGFRVADATWLVNRYNVALVQALLFGAAELQLRLRQHTAPRLRQLFRWIKFHQLLFKASLEKDELVVTLDGPVSLFGPSTRYGQQLARFFPAVLLQPGPWTLTADVRYSPYARAAAARKTLTVTDTDGFVSHYADTGAYRSKTHEHFVAQWNEQERPYVLEEDGAPRIGKGHTSVPDFTLTHRKGGNIVLLELMGYWRRERLDEVLAATDGLPIVLAVSRKLAAAKNDVVPDHARVVSYAEVLPLRKVLDAADRISTASKK